ncbi:MAG: regulatory protein RecX [Alphaproteobacteria bacterium]|nr:regulatory protein RecX [Alphaproteobacteria bacterium]
MNSKTQPQKQKALKKITKIRLKNIGLYYLERFESSVQNLRDVLKRRVDRYAYQNPDFDKNQAYLWIEEILADFQNWNYVSDERYALLKIKDYLATGKSARYIKTKLKMKGIDENAIDDLIEKEEYNPKEFALKLAKKRKIGPFRQNDDERKENRQKDMGILLRAGFDYDVVCDILGQSLDDTEV